MSRALTQRLLQRDQLREFGHDRFVEEQVRDFALICPVRSGEIADLGGGCGHFSRALAERFPGIRSCVIDLDRDAVDLCEASALDARQADIIRYAPTGQRAACFNLVLHHLVGRTDAETRTLQKTALLNWRRSDMVVFVNEYVYDCRFGDLSGRLIYEATSGRRVSALARRLAQPLRALRANTAGVGVRFRSRTAWEALFREAGFEVTASIRGAEEKVRWPLDLFVRSIRRDSFLLAPTQSLNPA